MAVRADDRKSAALTDAPPFFVVAAVAFRRRGDRTWVALAEGAPVGIVAATLLGLVLAVTVGGR